MTSEEETLGDRIRIGRARRKVTLRGLAEATGKSASYMSDIENDRRIPSEEVLRAIGVVLQLDPDELLAAAGRLGEDADRYIRRNPQAGILFRRLSERNVSPRVIARMLKETPELHDLD